MGKRVFLIILDGVGAGESVDAAKFGDQGSNSLAHCAEAFHKKGKLLSLPNLASLGISNITSLYGTDALKSGQGMGGFGKCQERSIGKDTTTGHWEMVGLELKKPFALYPNGFPKAVVEEWVTACGLPGVLGNRSASGTEIIEELGEEHLKSGKPILYTSADSVWQVAAHETGFGLQKLYDICKVARKICDRLQVGRVIARPFIGTGKGDFQRTYNRKDLSVLPTGKTVLDELGHAGVPVYGIGKISNIFAAQGVPENKDTEGNVDGIKVLIESMDQVKSGLVFCNLIDFDMLYGHRRDPIGYGKALEEFDRAMATILKKAKKDDLIIISSDHGNDPTFPGSDHTREYVPLLAFSPSQKASGAIDLGTRSSFADIGATAYHALTGKNTVPAPLLGKSFLPTLLG